MADYIRDLSGERREEVVAALIDIEEYGLEGAMVAARHLEGKLWELKFAKDRVFYVMLSGPEMVLLHAYKKQGQKAPPRELDTARRRMKDVLAE